MHCCPTAEFQPSFENVDTQPFSIVSYSREPLASRLGMVAPRPVVKVRSAAELMVEASRRHRVVVFIDADLLSELSAQRTAFPVVAIIEDQTNAALPKAVKMFAAYPWISHCISAAMLTTPDANKYLGSLLDRLLTHKSEHMLGASGVGRVALLARASRREERFERMQQFFKKHKLSARALTALAEVAEELVMNARYDAPLEAGHFKQAVPRTDDVSLPDERACEISYGVEGEHAFVRLRDTFGALQKSRLLEVLVRCSGTTDVQLDESRGGAGLGLWRVFSSASSIIVTVVPGSVTDILVNVALVNGKLVKQMTAINLFFTPPKKEDWLDDPALRGRPEMFDESITLLLVA